MAVSRLSPFSGMNTFISVTGAVGGAWSVWEGNGMGAPCRTRRRKRRGSRGRFGFGLGGGSDFLLFLFLVVSRLAVHVGIGDPLMEQAGQDTGEIFGKLVQILEGQLGFVKLAFSKDALHDRVHMILDAGRSRIGERPGWKPPPRRPA